MSHNAPLAVIRMDRQLEVLGDRGQRIWRTGGAPDGVQWAQWASAVEGASSMYSWPTWDPNGERIACFRSTAESDGLELVVHHRDGIRSDVLMRFGDRVPIYSQWSPNGTRLAVLYQEKTGDRLCLSRVDRDGTEVLVAQGSPLFFTWSDPEHLACFIGGGEDHARMALVNVDTGRQDLLPGQPDYFCAPVNCGRRTAYLAHLQGRVSVWVADRSAAREIEPINGLVALLADPEGKRLARAIAPDERSSYRDLSIIELPGGEPEQIDDEPCTAFWWTPDGASLLVARTEMQTGMVSWSRIDLHDRTHTHLGDVRPTRDMRFYLRFFEQFAPSHPLIDPGSRFVVLAGELDRAGNQSGLWKLPLDGGPPQQLGDGLLAVWGPPG